MSRMVGSVASALASPTRREIVRLVWAQERPAGEIASAFQVSWPAISQNLRVLRESGLVRERRLGTSARLGYFSQHRADTLDPDNSVLEEVRRSAPELRDDDLRAILGSFLAGPQWLYL